MPKRIHNIFDFWHFFLTPYLRVLLPLIALNMLPGFMMSLRPLVLSPILGKVLPNDKSAATTWSEVSLDNLGATILAVIGDPSQNMSSAFLISGVLYFALTFLCAGTGGLSTILSLNVRLKILKDMTLALHRHLLGLHLGFHLQQKTGELISRFSLDLAKTAASLEVVFSNLVRSSMQLIIYVAVLFYSAPLVTFQVIAVGSLHMAVTRLLGGKVRQFTRESYDVNALQTAVLQETFQNIRTIKSFSAENVNSREVHDIAENVRKVNFKFMTTRYLEEPTRLLADGLVIVAILPIAYRAISNGEMTLAGITLYLYIASQLVVPISEISRQTLSIFGMQGGFSRLVQIFSAQNVIEDGLKEIEKFSKKIVIENVSFGFGSTQVLQNVSLEVGKGEVVGVVGESGGGKSTLIDLVLRLYDPHQGRILCDDQDLRTLKQKSYRSLFGIVSQECLLFNASLKDNITFGRTYSQELLERACRIANLTEFIGTLPIGLETEVGDRGVRLSGGQRQRVAIARAVYAKPEILVLDEATSALDTASERKVLSAINQATRDITSIIIAHRLSTITHADKIVVMDKGKIDAIGRHEDLLETCDIYRRLHALQDIE